MAENSKRPERIKISPEAGRDLSATYIQTAQSWGQEQAERYDDFLEEILNALAESPEKGRLVAGRPGIRSYIAKWGNARYGHRIVFRETANGIFVMRVLHTAMNWLEHF